MTFQNKRLAMIAKAGIAMAVLGLLATGLIAGPAAAGSEEFDYRFEFLNGVVLEGTASEKVTYFANAGGSDANNPSGMDMHLSCSDEFPGGWGEKDGPDQNDDSAWQLASWSIDKIKDGKIDKSCGNDDKPGSVSSIDEGYAYTFNFVNGQIVTGISEDKVGFIPNAGGQDASNPTGMEVHLSCSDEFPGGWGEKDGPDQNDDSAWQLASWSIDKIKDGKVDKNCNGDSKPGDPGVPSSGEYYHYIFEFVNGQVADGASEDKVGFVPNAGGQDANNPTGMEVHLSCSDEFPGGWGEKDGPDQNDDSAWQILRWTIEKIKDGKVDNTCNGGLPKPPAKPGIDLEMYVNGYDADDPTGPVIPVGQMAHITYTVTNTGNVDLFDVDLFDFDAGTIGCPMVDLAPGATMECDARDEMVYFEGQQFGESDVVGLADVGPPTAPSDGKVKIYSFTFVNGQTVTGMSEDNTTFIANAGGNDANNPTGMEVHTSCSDEFPGGWGEKDGPDQNDDSAWQIASYSIQKWDDGELKKTCGDKPGPVYAEIWDYDPIYYMGVPPKIGIDIEMATNGIDADFSPGVQVPLGQVATLTYVVTNVGVVDLEDIVVTDVDEGVRTCESTTLAVGASMTCDSRIEMAFVANVPGEFQERGATAVGTAFGFVDDDFDPTHYFVTDAD